jgi:hypothetical protein
VIGTETETETIKSTAEEDARNEHVGEADAERDDTTEPRNATTSFASESAAMDIWITSRDR